MAFQRGDVVLIPFPFTDLTATKTRPTVMVSSVAYQSVRSELLLAYVSSQVIKALSKSSAFSSTRATKTAAYPLM